MHFEWDEAKNKANISKHGIDFNDVPDIFRHPMLALRDDRVDYGEERWISTSDIPELDAEFFRRAELRVPVKQAVTIRLDADVLEWFKGQGTGYQTRINQLLRQYMQAHQG